MLSHIAYALSRQLIGYILWDRLHLLMLNIENRSLRTNLWVCLMWVEMSGSGGSVGGGIIPMWKSVGKYWTWKISELPQNTCDPWWRTIWCLYRWLLTVGNDRGQNQYLRTCLLSILHIQLWIMHIYILVEGSIFCSNFSGVRFHSYCSA